jgi:hypothetical protein
MAAILAETIQIPFPIKLRAVQLYWDLLQTLLAQRDHQVTLDCIEPDPTGDGWLTQPLSRYRTMLRPKDAVRLIRWRFSCRSNHQMQARQSCSVC